MTVSSTIAQQPAPQLYVVVNVLENEDGTERRVTVTDPMLKADAELIAREDAPYYAGRLEVAPARPEDLADVAAVQDAAEHARDRALADVGWAVIVLRTDGVPDTEIIDTVLTMIELRMKAGRVDAVDALTGSDQ